MSTMATPITSVSVVCSNVGSDTDQRKHQSSSSLAGEFPTQKASNAEMFPFHDVIMGIVCLQLLTVLSIVLIVCDLFPISRGCLQPNVKD